MNSRVFGIIGVLAGLGLAACHNDPLGDLDGTPTTMSLSANQFILNPGANATFTASLLDGRGVPLQEAITFTSRDPAVASVAVDPSYVPVPATSARAVVTAGTPGALTYIVATAAGISDSVAAGVLPTNFGGAVPASADVGSVITIGSTPVLKFDPATVSVAFGGGETPPILSKTADQLQVLVPSTDPGPLTISGIAVTFAPGLLVSLSTATSFTPTGGDPYPGDNDWPTAPDITSLLPAPGGSTTFLAVGAASNPAGVCPEDRVGFGPNGTCDIFEFTLADTTTISFTTDWDGGSGDVDLLICSDSTAASFSTSTGDPCAGDGFAGASSSKPETAGGVPYPPGTYWFAAQDWDGGGVKNYYITIKIEP